MPTPSGRPKVGEYIVARDGSRGLVTRRSDGNSYSVWVKWPPGKQQGSHTDSHGVTIITEFEWWKQNNGWTISKHAEEPPVPLSIPQSQSRINVLREISAERVRQDAKWGEQNHIDGTGGPGSGARAALAQGRCQTAHAAGQDNWMLILDEEVQEAFAESDPTLLRAELIQVAAVAAQWVEAIDRRIDT